MIIFNLFKFYRPSIPKVTVTEYSTPVHSRRERKKSTPLCQSCQE